MTSLDDNIYKLSLSSILNSLENNLSKQSDIINTIDELKKQIVLLHENSKKKYEEIQRFIKNENDSKASNESEINFEHQMSEQERVWERLFKKHKEFYGNS